MSVFKVNGIDLPPPTKCVYSFADLSSDESGRSTRDGSMQKDIIAQKRTLTFTWGILPLNDASIVMQLCKNKGAVVWLTFPDILTAKIATMQFYTGDMSNADYLIPAASDIRINGMSCSFIEV